MDLMTSLKRGAPREILASSIITLSIVWSEFDWIHWFVIPFSWMTTIFFILERATKRHARRMHVLRGTIFVFGVVTLILSIMYNR